MFEMGSHTCSFYKHHFGSTQSKWGVLLSVLVMRCSLRLSTHALAGFTWCVLNQCERSFTECFHLFSLPHVSLSLSLFHKLHIRSAKSK